MAATEPNRPDSALRGRIGTRSPGEPDRRWTVRDLLRVHRLEFPFWVNTACQALWGAAFAATTIGELAAPATLLALVANLAILLAGLVLNTAVDIESDRRHPDRRGLSGAALRLGRRTGLRLATAEFGSGVLLAAAVSVWTGRWPVLGAALGAVGAHLLYNVRPARLKARGIAGPVVFAVAAITLPCLLSYAAVRPAPPAALWSVFAGLTVLTIGRVVWWSVPDVTADAAAGVRTTGVRRGAHGALGLACGVLALGAALLGLGLWWHAGVPAAAFGVFGHLLFLGTAVRLRHRVRRGAVADSRRLRRKAMPLVLVADVVLVGLALLSG